MTGGVVEHSLIILAGERIFHPRAPFLPYARNLNANPNCSINTTTATMNKKRNTTTSVTMTPTENPALTEANPGQESSARAARSDGVPLWSPVLLPLKFALLFSLPVVKQAK